VIKFWLSSFHVRAFLSIVCINLTFFFACRELPSLLRFMTVPFFACKDFFLSPLVSLVLPSYVKDQA